MSSITLPAILIREHDLFGSTGDGARADIFMLETSQALIVVQTLHAKTA
jgi:hypothetical protein